MDRFRILDCAVRLVAPVMVLLLLASPVAQTHAQPQPKRTMVFISDTHMGIGKKTDGTWYATEDFRWGTALDGFLDHLDSTYPGPVDLLFLGDVLELWQPFPGMQCTTPAEETSCTVEEMAKLAEWVARAHANDLRRIGDFSRRGDNRVYIIPGNHDAALVEATVWHKVVPAFGVNARVDLVDKGIWASPSGRTVVEHGHQIGKDVNQYKRWPNVRNADHPDHLARPWGELFVQKLFNEVEAEYPLIDNIGPESVGAKYRLADKGLGRTAADLGRFILFNLFETSGAQQARFLSRGDEDDGNARRDEWKPDLGRQTGYQLVVDSLAPDDDFRKLITEQSEQGQGIRDSIDAHVRDKATFPDASIMQLCDQAAINDKFPCRPSFASNMLEGMLRKEEEVVLPHAYMRKNAYPDMTKFIYGHTHKYMEPWDARRGGQVISVANTGAFQRVVDEKQFERRAQGFSKSEALRKVTIDSLPACYTFIVVEDERAPMKLWRWYQPEDVATGSRKPVQSEKCL